MTGRQARSAETRARIIAAARQLFARDGFEHTTTRAIAKAAHIAHGTLFRYAPTKEDVVEMVFASAIGDALDDVLAKRPPAPHEASFVDVALRAYDAFFDVYGADPALARVLVKELPFLEGDAGLRQHLLTARLFESLVADLERRQEAGLVDVDAVPFVVATHSFALYFAALVGWLTGQLDREGARHFLVASHLTLVKGLQP